MLFRVWKPYAEPITRDAFWDFPADSMSRAYQKGQIRTDLHAAHQVQPNVRYAHIRAADVHGADMDPKSMSVDMLRQVSISMLCAHLSPMFT